MMKITELFVILSLAMSLMGCPDSTVPIKNPTPQKTENVEAEKLYNEGVKNFNDQNFDAANETFQKFHTQFEDDPLSPSVYIYRGRLALEVKEYEKARDYFQKVYDLGEDSSNYDVASMFLGITEFQVNNYEKAIEYLKPYAGRFADEAKNTKVLWTLYNSAKAIDNWKDEIVWIEQYLKVPLNDEEKRSTQNDLQRAISAKTEEELKKAAKALSSKSYVWTMVMAQIASIQFEQEKYNDATDTIEEIKESGTENLQYIKELIELIEKRNQTDMRTIGCLLPLSGKMRLVGNEALKGVMLASKKKRFGKEAAPLSVVIRDTQSSSQKAEELVEDLVINSHVSAIIGPMGNSFSKIAAKKAERLGVPMILLATNDQISQTGPYIFRKFASNKNEIQALLNLTPADETTFAIVHPKNGYGKQMKKLFEQELNAQNKEIAAAIEFDPAIKDFSVVAKELSGANFDVLFLPMTSSQLALAAPAFAAHGIWPSENIEQDREEKPEMKFASYWVPSVGYSPSLVSRAGRYLQGTKFIVAYSMTQSKTSVQFDSSFNDEYKKSPTAFAAYGYDAAILLSNAIQAGVTSRRELKIWLDETPKFEGMVHPFENFDESGEAVGLPAIKTLKDSQLE